MKIHKKAFTLVEILVVIIILTILTSIAFISLRSYPTSTRDTVRTTDLYSIKKTLDLYAMKKRSFPQPDLATETTEDGWVRGVFGNSATSTLQAIQEIPTDPTTNEPYIYEVSPSGKAYRLIALSEETGEEIIVSSNLNFSAITDNSSANTDNSSANTDNGNVGVSNCDNNNHADEKYFSAYNGKILTYDINGGSDLIIPCSLEGIEITSIGVSAFKNKQLTSVVIPDTVTTIGVAAFEGNKLTSVDLGNSVTEISTSAFSGNQIKSITIPGSIKQIGVAAFSGNQLTDVIIEDSTTGISEVEISTTAFSGNQITNLELGNSISEIGVYAFKGNNLTTITIPDSIKQISTGAFEYNGPMNNSQNIKDWIAGNGGTWNLSGTTWVKEQ